MTMQMQLQDARWPLVLASRPQGGDPISDCPLPKEGVMPQNLLLTHFHMQSDFSRYRG